MNLRKNIIIVIGVIFFSSCTIQMQVDDSKNNHEAKSQVKIVAENIEQKDYIGWWVYGKGQHIFKNEETLEEYDLIFPNENMEELVGLYISVCEMEYFPMECKMTGYTHFNDLTETTELIVLDFEILYIQGCGETFE